MNEEKQNSIKMCNKRFITTLQQKVSTNISSPTDVKIAKMLSLKTQPTIENVEVFNGGFKASLNVEYEAVVCLENGEIVCSEKQQTTTQVTYENSVISSNSAVKIIPCVMDSETTISQGEVNVNSLVNLEVFVESDDCCFCPPVVDESINVKTQDSKVCTNKGKIFAKGLIKGEVSVDNKFRKIIFSSYTGYLKGYDIKTDYFVINGEMFANFLCEYEDGQLKSFTKTFDFSEEIEQKGILAEDILQLDFTTLFKPNTNLVVGSNGETIIDIEMPYVLRGDIYTCYNQETIVDAYDTSKEVNLTTESFDHCINKPSYFAEDKIIAGFNISEDAPRIERILGTAGENISVVNTIVKNGEIILEGIASVGVIYYSEDEDGNKVLNSVVVDLPYSLNVNNSEIKENDIAIVDLKLGEISVKNKKGRELEVVANVYVTYCLATPTISAFTTNIAFGEEKASSPYALEIVVAKENETLWDIAKRLSIKEEQLISQNSDVVLPLSGGEKLVVFRGVNNN